MSEKDPRITAKHISLKYYVILFLFLAVETNVMFNIVIADESFVSEPVAAFFFALLLLTTVVIVVIIGVIRHYTYNRPLLRLCDAARRVAAGDFSVRIAPVQKDGKKDYIDVMIDDFNTMAKELESIETLKQDFIANVSHEIKTPLNVIQSYASSIKSDSLSDETKEEYAAIIVDASEKLSALVTNILKLNKLENQEIIPTTAPYDLSEQLRCCVLSFEDLWVNKDISFTTDVPDEEIINYDANMLEIVWNNLLSNAIRFTEPGGLILVTLKNDSGFIFVSVSDNGCGMDEMTKRRVFDKFYQGDTSHSQQGNGLGLALVKRIIEILGGVITVDSQAEIGTTFTVKLKTK